MDEFLIRYRAKFIFHDYPREIEKSLLVKASSRADAFICAYDYLTRHGHLVNNLLKKIPMGFNDENPYYTVGNACDLSPEEVKQISDAGVNITEDLESHTPGDTEIISIGTYKVAFSGVVISDK